MKSLFPETIYILDTAINVWSRPSYSGIAYSDGDEVEQRIAAIIEQANDLTVLSTELRQHCTDWPSLYHLSGTRANILRPFEADLHGDILEIGAGCGTITRYLGECGGNILALEGSPRRAAIARSRTRDLENVTVLAEKFDQFQCDHRFDVVTLIGVLEYANIFNTSGSPALAMLERVRSLLKPEGKLIIAIENQLGLKYFAGAPEDHLGQPMYGIEGRYRKDQPQTFGRKVLTEILKQAGFVVSDFFAPFPDYKLPASILTESGINNLDFDAAALAWQCVRRDPQLPPYCSFSLELAWPEVFKNGMALDVANSFLIAASPKVQRFSDSDAEVLAYHYSTDRAPQYCKETRFEVSADKAIQVVYKRLGAAHQDSQVVDNQIIDFNCPATDRYSNGKTMLWEFIQIVTRDGWAVEEAGEFLRRYISVLEHLLGQAGITSPLTSPDVRLPGKFFDLVPQNIIILTDGTPVIIDEEWSLRDDVELGQLLFRGLFWMVGAVSRFGQNSTGRTFSRGEFVKSALAAVGFAMNEKEFSRYIEVESAVQGQVTGRSARGLLQSLAWWSSQPLPHSLVQDLTERDDQIANLNQAVAERDGQIASLNQAVSERDGQIANLNQAVAERDRQVASVFRSSSWRLTEPLRVIKRLARSETSSLKPLLRACWRRLPLSVRYRMLIRTALRRYFPITDSDVNIDHAMPSVVSATFADESASGYKAEYRKRFSVALNRLNPDFVPLAGDHIDPEQTSVKVIAFYLPQFHPIPENDGTWGLGFTEWTNVSKAVPQFIGHYQPRLPGELGFYDLRLKEIQKRQIEMARQYGIHGFCYHHYWFAGKRVLERPFQQVLEDPTLDLPFCLCWANENWTKRWDGGDHDIILAQNHSPEDDILFFEDILPALKDPRYIRIDDKPLLIVYRPGLLPDPAATAQRWRQIAVDAGLPGLYIASAATFGFEDYKSIGYDGLVQFPPHNIPASEIVDRLTLLNPNFSGHVYDYIEYSENALKTLAGKKHTFPCVMMNWDNEARKPGRGHIFLGGTPECYKRWLRRCFDFVLANNAKEERLVFVNAWNEWAEGTYLEPDRRYGYAYLHATATVHREYYKNDGVAVLIQANNEKFEKKNESALIAHWYYFDLFDDLKKRLAGSSAFDVFMTIPEHSTVEQVEMIISTFENVYLILVKNRGRDILPFLFAFPQIESLGYRYLLKVHSKKSMHRSDGDHLRNNAMDELLEIKSIDRVLSFFEANTDVGMLGPSNTLLSLMNEEYLVNNRQHLESCLSKLGYTGVQLTFSFISGSMFWARVDALTKIHDLNLFENDFEEELGQIDGTMAHAVERLFGYLAIKSGYRVLTLDQVDFSRVP